MTLHRPSSSTAHLAHRYWLGLTLLAGVVVAWILPQALGRQSPDPTTQPANTPATETPDPHNTAPHSQAQEGDAPRPRPGPPPALRNRVEQALRDGGLRRHSGPPGRAGARDLFNRPEFRDISKEPPSDDEWAQITQFMSEKSPVRLRVYQRVVERVGEDSGVAEKVRTRYAVLYRWMQATRQRMPEIVEFNERQFVLEDQILGLILRAKLRRNDDTGLLDQQRSELVNQFIQNNLAGREKRLDRLRMMIQEEERRLARDRENLDRARDRVNQRFDSEFGPLVSRAQDLFDDEADVPVVLPTTQPSK